MSEEQGWIKTALDGDRLVVAVGGRWTIGEAARLDDDLGQLSPGAAKSVWIDMGSVEVSVRSGRGISAGVSIRPGRF